MDMVFLGRLILGTRGPKKFERGHIISRRPITPPYLSAKAQTILDSYPYTAIKNYKKSEFLQHQFFFQFNLFSLYKKQVSLSCTCPELFVIENTVIFPNRSKLLAPTVSR